jgi:outer membrane protein OmpA-like peptidoglycan-associated protein
LGIGMPIDAALALMKDKKGNITIEVPVSGNLEDPNFAIGPAFRKAMLQAVKKGSVTYAAYVLQPYGSILIGAKLLGKATALRLESVRFDDGEAKLNQRAKNYLKKIAGLMNERPGINITLCGSATGSDRKELSNRNVNQMEQALRSLAEQRGDEVKKHLIDQFGIAADRFFDCQPRVTSDESAQPEVRLGL